MFFSAKSIKGGDSVVEIEINIAFCISFVTMLNSVVLFFCCFDVSLKEKPVYNRNDSLMNVSFVLYGLSFCVNGRGYLGI
jgi:hypothetical protein